MDTTPSATQQGITQNNLSSEKEEKNNLSTLNAEKKSQDCKATRIQNEHPNPASRKKNKEPLP